MPEEEISPSKTPLTLLARERFLFGMRSFMSLEML